MHAKKYVFGKYHKSPHILTVLSSQSLEFSHPDDLKKVVEYCLKHNVQVFKVEASK